MLPKLNKFNLIDYFYGDDSFIKRENDFMRTDIKEKEGNYILEIDIPGCEKKNIQIELNNGCITVTATMSSETNENDEKEHFVQRERFYGKCSRSYYAGENITEDDIKASFTNGILTLTFPKEKAKENEKKYIEID